MGRPIPIELNKSEIVTLRRWARQLAGRLALRAHIVLLASLNWSNVEIAAELKTDPHTVARWRNRFALRRLAGIQEEAPRSGRKRRAREKSERHILRVTKRLGPGKGVRAVARVLGVNHMLVYRVWKDHGIAP